jgi:superoxide dismutase, Cu-Zn family
MRFVPTLTLAAVAALAGCAHKPAAPVPAPVPAAAPAPGASPDVKVTESYFSRTKAAVATLSPSASDRVSGIVVFTGGGASVDVHVTAAGLLPGSIHGFFVHEVGNCASADFASAGPHFNPTRRPHGPQDRPHHAGDMPSLLADPEGRIDARFTLDGVTLGGADGFVGRSVVIHASGDNADVQPNGTAGPGIACGVIAAQ